MNGEKGTGARLFRMGLGIRWRSTSNLQSTEDPADYDDALDTVAKLVPAEALAAYVGLVGIAPGSHEEKYLFIFFGIGLALTALSLCASNKKHKRSTSSLQMCFRLAAFAAYALVISEPLGWFVTVDSRIPMAFIFVLTAVMAILGYANSGIRRPAPNEAVPPPANTRADDAEMPPSPPSKA